MKTLTAIALALAAGAATAAAEPPGIDETVLLADADVVAGTVATEDDDLPAYLTEGPDEESDGAITLTLASDAAL